MVDHLLDARHAGEALDDDLGLRRVDEVDPERLVQQLGGHVVGRGRVLELLLEVLVRLLVVLEVELVDERRERVGRRAAPRRRPSAPRWPRRRCSPAAVETTVHR